jgi:N-formylglutamate amidohydrolase
MKWTTAGIDDSDHCPAQGAAVIPGSDGVPSYVLKDMPVSPIPVLIAAPHAGRCYPPRLASQLRHHPDALHRLEDRLVDRLADAVAQRTGAALLVAHAPRAMIDLNRGIDDMDWEMIADHRPSPTSRASRRARGGLGLVPRRLPLLGELWRGPLPRDEFDVRMAQVHAPYHAELAATLQRIRERWGAALLIDLHSMPPLAPNESGAPGAQFVIGDRFGASCAGSIASAAFDYFARQRRRVAHNRPYAGGYALDRHCARLQGVHALQLEVCRSIYLDGRLQELSDGFESIASLLGGLVAELASLVAGLGRRSAMLQAAE